MSERWEPAEHPDGTGRVRAVMDPNGTGHLEAELQHGLWLQLRMPEWASGIVSDGARWCWRGAADE